MHGGGNNRVFRVSASRGTAYLLKAYFHAPSDPRNRFEHEHTFYRLLQKAGISQVPQAVGWDPAERLGLFEFVSHPKLQPEDVGAGHIAECARFFNRINAARTLEEARSVPTASEACFSLTQHVEVIEKRVQRLAALEPGPATPGRVLEFVIERLLPAWERIRGDVSTRSADDVPLPETLRCLSPSDFGFHNALSTPSGLLFLDFEYAGWDDPAKMACDFFCQPDIPAPGEHLAAFIRETCLPGWDPAAYAARIRTLLPAYRIKWACIILNVFLKEASRRRAFADSKLLSDAACELQLAKANTQIEALAGFLP